jgi:hypothetical protein
MSRAALLARPVFPLLLAGALAACGDDSTGPNRLTPDEVSGNYQICALVFTPNQNFPPPVDVRLNAIEGTTGLLVLVPQNQGGQIAYTPKGGGLTQTINATYTLGRNQVTLNFGGQASARNALLLPDPLTLDYDALSRTLQTVTAPYSVPKASYEAVANVQFTNAIDPITGTLTASFTAGGCP